MKENESSPLPPLGGDSAPTADDDHDFGDFEGGDGDHEEGFGAFDTGNKGGADHAAVSGNNNDDDWGAFDDDHEENAAAAENGENELLGFGAGGGDDNDGDGDDDWDDFNEAPKIAQKEVVDSSCGGGHDDDLGDFQDPQPSPQSKISSTFATDANFTNDFGHYDSGFGSSKEFAQNDLFSDFGAPQDGDVSLGNFVS